MDAFNVQCDTLDEYDVVTEEIRLVQLKLREVGEEKSLLLSRLKELESAELDLQLKLIDLKRRITGESDNVGSVSGITESEIKVEPKVDVAGASQDTDAAEFGQKISGKPKRQSPRRHIYTSIRLKSTCGTVSCYV